MSSDPGPSGSESRGQVGLTKQQQNVRAAAQERERGRSEPLSNVYSNNPNEDEAERFVTSTEGAFNDLNKRATEGQIPQGNDEGSVTSLLNPLKTTATVANNIGKANASNIQQKIEDGGTPVFDDIGRIQGVVHEGGLFGGSVYTGNSDFNPSGMNKQPSSGSSGTGIQMTTADVAANQQKMGGGGGGVSQPAPDPFAAQRAELAAARANRANALATKQSELASAFGAFGDDFYEDLSTSFTDYQNPLLAQGYDDSLRGIYDGFKAKGLLTQAGLDSAIGGLDTARAAEASRVSQGAADYAASRKGEVTKKQQQLGDQLAALVGGATTAADVNAQTDAINAFDFSGDLTKLRTPAAKGNLDFFQGFNKVAANTNPQVNPQAVSTAGAVQTGEITPARLLTGIQSPYQGSSLKVVS